jgi:hypothetical protein
LPHDQRPVTVSEFLHFIHPLRSTKVKQESGHHKFSSISDYKKKNHSEFIGSGQGYPLSLACTILLCFEFVHQRIITDAPVSGNRRVLLIPLAPSAKDYQLAEINLWILFILKYVIAVMRQLRGIYSYCVNNLAPDRRRISSWNTSCYAKN